MLPKRVKLTARAATNFDGGASEQDIFVAFCSGYNGSVFMGVVNILYGGKVTKVGPSFLLVDEKVKR